MVFQCLLRLLKRELALLMLWQQQVVLLLDEEKLLLLLLDHLAHGFHLLLPLQQLFFFLQD